MATKAAPASRRDPNDRPPVLGPARPRGTATPGQRWRYRRDLILAACHLKLGISQRMLADVFLLSRSRVGAIVEAMRGEALAAGLDDPEGSP